MKRRPLRSSYRRSLVQSPGCLIAFLVFVLVAISGCSDDNHTAKAGDPQAYSGSDENNKSTPTSGPSSAATQGSADTATTDDAMSITATQAANSASNNAPVATSESTSEPERQIANFAALPIGIAFVGMTDTASGITQFAAAADFADCPAGLALGWDQQIRTGPLWSDCAATHVTERINHAFQELLNTDQVVFESLGYSTFEAPEYSVFTSRAQVDAALQTLDSREFNTPGQITAIVSNWTHSIGGLAPYDQPLDEYNGIVLAISQVSDDAIIHEVGHTLGFRHTDEDPDQKGELTYDFCEALNAPILPKCNCEMNLMEAVSGVCSSQCGDKPYSFATPTHANYFRDVATCWLSERRFAGNAIECEWPEVAHCVGYENVGMTCSCLNGKNSLEMRSCVDATDDEITELLETCDAEPSTENLCTSFVAYPGVYCFERAGNYDCACLSDDTPFETGKPCNDFTASEIYATCLKNKPENTCKASLGTTELSCVETDDALECICSNSGSTLSSEHTKCSEVDLNDWILSCPSQ